jgi:diguanylate cyclase (GGDEF)-like protein/PAS domain S-box-containing protein
MLRGPDWEQARGSSAAPRVRRDSLALVFIFGPLLALAWVALPHLETGSSEVVAVAACVGGFAWGVLLLVLPARFRPTWLVHVTLVLGTVLITVAVEFTGGADSRLTLFYLWTTPYAYLFFSARRAGLHTAWVALCFAVVLMHPQHVTSLGRHAGEWLVIVGTLVAVGVLVRRLAESMRDSDARFRRGFDDSSFGVALISTQSRFLEVNDAVCALLGRSREQVLGAHVSDFTLAEDAHVTSLAFDADLPAERAQQTVEKRLVRADGSVALVSVSSSLVRNDAGRPLYFFTQVHDITAARSSERSLAGHARQHEAVARLGHIALRDGDLKALMHEVIETVSSTLNVELCNVLELSGDADGLSRVAGVGWSSYGLARSPSPLIGAGSHAQYTLTSKQPVLVNDFSTETRFSRSSLLTEQGVLSGLSVVIDGRDHPFGVLAAHSTRAHAFTADDVNFVQAVANVISTAVERRRNEESSRHAALHDALTGLPNRTLVLDRIESALRTKRSENSTVAVLMLDLDRFKIINDSLGHAQGDELLRLLAPRLREAVRAGDTVGRLGGDEFVVVCAPVEGAEAAVAVAERLAHALTRPVVLHSGEHIATASIGIAVACCEDATAESLLRDADAAMYRAKDAGRGRHELFDEPMREHALNRLRVETDLRRALDRDELRVHYQPIVDLQSGRPLSVEALVRWEHPERGLVPPGDFIPVAEETGLIADIGLWVLEHACAQVAEWQRGLGLPLQLSVNVSGRQIARPDFPAQVGDIVQRSGLQQGTLGLEMTESVLIEEAESPLAVLAMLREHDLRLVLDDFGTGYSSLSYLKRFNLDAIKVDRSFVQGLGTDPDDSAIVEAIVKMAQTLGLDVVAEGVETEQQRQQLARLGCRQAQGYLFARPLPALAAGDFLGGHADEFRIRFAG